MRNLVAIVAGVLASGCSAVYHDSWAKKADVKAGGCPNLEGEYRNEGEMFRKGDDGQLERHTVLLADALNADFYHPFLRTDPAEKFRLESVYKAIRVTTTFTDGSTQNFERPTAGCSDSMLVLEAKWTGSLQEEPTIGSTVIGFYERSSTQLSRAQDGSLLVRFARRGSLHLFYVPVLPGGDSVWFRFPEVGMSTAEGVASPPQP